MRLDGFNLVVSDMAASVAFFELLELEVRDTMPEFIGVMSPPDDAHRSAPPIP